MRDRYWLSRGSHRTPEEGRCALEWVSYLAGEPHSASPACVSPILRDFCMAFNDRLPDDERQKLRPFLARTIGTAGDGRDPERVAMCREHLVKTALPRLLDVAGHTAAAQWLRDLPDALDALDAENVCRVVAKVQEEAYEARREARAKLQTKYASSDAAAAATAKTAAADDAAYAAIAYVAADVAYAYANAAANADAYAASAFANAYAASAYANAAAFATSSLTYDEVYVKARAAVDEAFRPLVDQARREGFALLERMLPTEVVRVPAAADATAVCTLP